MTAPHRTRGPLDVVSLVFGLLMVGIATTALWSAWTGTLNWSLLEPTAPLALVAVGALGLLFNRRR